MRQPSYMHQPRIHRSPVSVRQASILQHLNIDQPLASLLLALAFIGLLTLYSASSGDWLIVKKQAIRMGVAALVMLICAQISPRQYQRLAPQLYLVACLLLLAVMASGHIGKGAKRWLDFGLLRFQPSEVMKLALVMTLSRFFHHRALPPRPMDLVCAAAMIACPALLIAKQPDLGTAILVASSGCFVIYFAGVSARLMVAAFACTLACLPWLWWVMHDYQRQRVLTLIWPERDPLASGYNIIQSKIAIGSGGLFGKGWMQGTQSNLEFLPERTTDFVFAVFSEEWGLMGNVMLLGLYLAIIGRCLHISIQCQDTFSRLCAASLSMTVFVYLFVNIGMVSGLLPVVGIPLPLISYGGTSLVTLLASFGILMSLHAHQRLLRS